MRYFIDAKVVIGDLAGLRHDIFISAYNDSARVQKVFSGVVAPKKFWWILPEYNYSATEVASLPNHILFTEHGEADLVMAGLESIKTSLVTGSRLCVDITGFMRSHILFLMKYLRDSGIKSFDALYTEPSHYSRKADTTFSKQVSIVRQVEGFEGAHQSDVSNDVLLLGVGYDHDPMARTILHKDNARLVQLHSLPSLSADMYHESLLRLYQVSSVSARPNDESVYFASANDPFVTASALSRAWREMNARRAVTNLYLCPLATKAQALGFGLFFLSELENTPASIILPSIESYSRETSTGVGRSWLYPISLA
jgi:hypothetical protein